MCLPQQGRQPLQASLQRPNMCSPCNSVVVDVRCSNSSSWKASTVCPENGSTEDKLCKQHKSRLQQQTTGTPLEKDHNAGLEQLLHTATVGLGVLRHEGMSHLVPLACMASLLQTKIIVSGSTRHTFDTQARINRGMVGECLLQQQRHLPAAMPSLELQVACQSALDDEHTGVHARNPDNTSDQQAQTSSFP